MNYFDEHGYLIGDIPEECIKDCSSPGDCYKITKYWVDKLNFSVPKELSIEYLSEFGAWEREELESSSDGYELAIIVLWIACGDIQENGEWLGLIH